MEKMSKVMGDVFNADELPAPGTSTAAGEGEDEEEDDGTPAIHNCASNGELLICPVYLMASGWISLAMSNPGCTCTGHLHTGRNQACP